MNYDVEKIWQDVQVHLSKEIKGPSFQTWIKPSKLIELKEDKATLAVKNEFNKNFLKQCYIDKISYCIEKTIKRKITLEIVVKSDLKISEFVSSIANLKEVEIQPLALSPQSATNLNPSYTFENFVVGPCNQFCHAAALAIAETQGELYNPLFIYSGVGLGKTHLVHAIANYAMSENKNAHVKYTSSESFTNELIQSIRTNSMSGFREKFRHVDILMIDDVQFLAGKEATQEEFFHTFNTLKENGKQVILTADRPPSSLSSIADRLRSRFEGGLIANIQFPDLETRTAIILLKAERLNINLQMDVAEYIATMYSNNIRELEGVLKRVHAYFSFTQEEINLKNVQRVLSSNHSSCNKPSPETMLKIVASFYNISSDDLISLKRSSDLTLPRHIAIYLLHNSGLSFPRIGELLSKRTHSSAIYAYKQIKKKLEQDKVLSENVNSLMGLIERRR
ncbi:MAG: chromosomal replication initiator protein DnaA [Candidatus Melainabacteria bacterium]|nr:chromosomal replication initiator protein DnaA [Candidatus Melainabacteria bacterium]